MANLAEVQAHGSLRNLLDLACAVLHGGILEGDKERAFAHREHRKRIREDKPTRCQRRARRAESRLEIRREFAAWICAELDEIWVPVEGPPNRGTPEWKRGPFRRWKDETYACLFRSFIGRRDEEHARLEKVKKRCRESALLSGVLAASPDALRLLDEIARMFAAGIEEERAQLARGESVSGLFAKWCPTPGGCHDKRTKLCSLICLHLKGGVVCGRGEGGPGTTRLAKVLSVLRRAAKVPESFVGSGEFGLVDYNRMPSLCRLKHGERVFKKHDPERYTAFNDEAAAAIADAKGRPRARVHTGTLLPHEVVKAAEEGSQASEAPVTPPQTQRGNLVCPQSSDPSVTGTPQTRAGRGAPVARHRQERHRLPPGGQDPRPGLRRLWVHGGPPDGRGGGPLGPRRRGPAKGLPASGHHPHLLRGPPGLPHPGTSCYPRRSMPPRLTMARGAGQGVPDHRKGEVPAPGALADRARQIKDTYSGLSTNFESCMGLVLDIFVSSGIPPCAAADVVLLVFSDMQFDSACG